MSVCQVVDEATQLAAGFLSIGLQPQDRVAVWAVNIYEWYLTQMAAAKAGLVLVSYCKYRTCET